MNVELSANLRHRREGDYVFPSLAVGTYTITVEAPGFKVFRRSGMTLTTEQNVRVDVRLEVGSVSESVNVTAEAPLVDSRSSVVGTLIDSRRVTDLPLNGRNIIGLAALLPGATNVAAPQTFTGDRSGPNAERLRLARQSESLSVRRTTVQCGLSKHGIELSPS